MGFKKGGANEKVESARDRKEAKKQEESAKKTKAAEDAYWEAAGDGQKGKGAAKREEEERKRQEAAARKAELKRLEEEEAASLAAGKAKAAAKAGSGKVTAHQLAQQKEEEERRREAEIRERELAAKREVSGDRYAAELDQHQNTNRASDIIEARSLDAALHALSVGEPAPADIHPEKRLKATYKAFEEATLAELKAEKPGLKMSQYKEMLWKLWQKSPDNPINQAALAAGAPAKK